MASEQRGHRSDRSRQCILRRENRAQSWVGGEIVEDGIGGTGRREGLCFMSGTPLYLQPQHARNRMRTSRSPLSFSQLQFPCLCSFKDPLHLCRGSNPLHLSPPALLFFLGLYPPDWDAEHLSTLPLAPSRLLGSPSEYKNCHVCEAEDTIH